MRLRPVSITIAAAFIALTVSTVHSQNRPWVQADAAQTSANREDPNAQEYGPEAELRKGTALTRKGSFPEAIPHLLAARGRVANDYAAGFNLALCYVGTRQFALAIETLNDLQTRGHTNADVENLLAQSFVGNGQSEKAFEALQRAAVLTPNNEKLYLFVADACLDRPDYSLGLRVAELGLKNLPDSATLHYQKAVFLTLLDESDQGREDFERARQLAPDTEIASLAAATEALYAGKPLEAVQAARQGASRGFKDPALLVILGESLLRSGARPGEPDFAEAQAALETAVAKNPRIPSAELSLGKLYLMAGHLPEALLHLERARDLEPRNVSVYANLAKAYQKHGDQTAARAALATLANLNQAEAEKISSAPGDRKAAYGERGVVRDQVPPP